ncbi:MAG TPA: Fur family transcriptional regulator [Candidatus Saccharimonadales bacterium]|nr:Fur family transcriptional regulator [Candidatus Saccharimonadales bacterium]
MQPEVIFAERLRQAGERISSPRLAIFRALNRKGTIYAPRLVEMMHESAVDPATTYRTLKLFRQLGVIRDIVAGGQRLVELSDDYGRHHHHFWCRQCGHLLDFDSPDIEHSLQRVAETLGVTITSHQLEISGLCTGCQNQQ